MAQVCHRSGPKQALGTLQIEAVRPERVEDGAEVLQVFEPRRTVDENIVEEHKDKPAQEGPQHIVHQRLERCWALEIPNGMTKNSKWPWCVRNAVLATSSGCICTW